MTDRLAGDIGIPADAIPRQEWGGRIFWPGTSLRATPRVITDGDAVSRAAALLLCKAHDEWMAVQPTHWTHAASTVDSVPIWPVPDTEHVHARAIYDSSYTTGMLERALVRMHVALGEEARIYRSTAAKMLIADDTALVIVPPGTGLLISDTADVDLMRARFERIWEKSLPFGRPALPPHQGKVLDLLIQGHDVDQIANDMGISENAVREHAQGIRRRLGARTMEQAAALAVLRGWVDVD